MTKGLILTEVTFQELDINNIIGRAWSLKNPNFHTCTTRHLLNKDFHLISSVLVYWTLTSEAISAPVSLLLYSHACFHCKTTPDWEYGIRILWPVWCVVPLLEKTFDLFSQPVQYCDTFVSVYDSVTPAIVIKYFMSDHKCKYCICGRCICRHHCTLWWSIIITTIIIYWHWT